MNNIRYSIRAKILFGFGIVIILVLSVGLVNYYQFKEVGELSQRTEPFSRILVQMQTQAILLNSLETNIEKYLLVGGEIYREGIINDIEKIREGMLFEKEGLSEDTLKDLEDFETEISGLEIEVLKLVNLDSNNKTSREHNEIVVSVYLKISEANKLSREITQSTIEDISNNVLEQKKIITTISSQSVIVSSVVFFFGIMIALLLSRAISNPLSKLRDASVKIGRGELNTRIRIKSNDEIGQLASAFTQMTSDLKKSRNKLEEESKHLEREVQKRTKELRSKMDDLEKINQFSMRREQKMIELKQEIEDLKEEIKEIENGRGLKTQLKNSDIEEESEDAQDKKENTVESGKKDK